MTERQSHPQCPTHVTSAGKLHADDTPVPVLAPGQGKTKRGRLWTWGVPTPAVPDNTKTAGTRACRYDPDLNPTYQEFAVHLRDGRGAGAALQTKR
jgi:hypothetical protein